MGVGLGLLYAAFLVLCWWQANRHEHPHHPAFPPACLPARLTACLISCPQGPFQPVGTRPGGGCQLSVGCCHTGLNLVAYLPALARRDLSSLGGTSALGVAASCLWVAATLALTLVAFFQGEHLHRMRAWPDWRQLSGGSGSGGGESSGGGSSWFAEAVEFGGGGGSGRRYKSSGSWFVEAVELAAVVPVLLVALACHTALHPVVSG